MSEERKPHAHKKWKDLSLGLKILAIAGGVIAGAGLLVLFGFIVMWLWNALMPKIFGLPAIGYWEAWGILVLSHILFRGFHGSRYVSDRSRRRKLRERIRQLDDEEGKETTAGKAPAE